MPTVFILNRGGHDYSEAERFGELAYVTHGNLDRFGTNAMYRACVDAFQKASDKDYIVITSLTILCAVACAVFARKFGKLNLLLFKDGKYIERKMLLDILLEEAT